MLVDYQNSTSSVDPSVALSNLLEALNIRILMVPLLFIERILHGETRPDDTIAELNWGEKIENSMNTVQWMAIREPNSETQFQEPNSRSQFDRFNLVKSPPSSTNYVIGIIGIGIVSKQLTRAVDLKAL